MGIVTMDNNKWIDETWNKIDTKLKRIAVKSRDKLPYTTINGIHDSKVKELDCWTNGFWGATMWLMYSETKNEEYKTTALAADKLLEGGLMDYKSLHHDVGFMWYITSGAEYRLTGNIRACNKALHAAAALAARYNINGKFIRAWNGENIAGWTIIDSMMNIPLLYWASEETGDPSFRRIALSHADMVLRDHLRSDGSINHVIEHDTDTGEVLSKPFTQGYNSDSCWSRGLAWAIYGITLSYIHIKKREYFEAAKRCANFFVANIVSYDYKTPIDFMAPLEPVYYDSTAGLCSACGLLELSKYVTEAEARTYRDAAINVLKATDKYFADYSEEEDALVLMGSENYPISSIKGLHIPIIYADFFYVEAMLKLKGNDFLIW